MLACFLKENLQFRLLAGLQAGPLVGFRDEQGWAPATDRNLRNCHKKGRDGIQIDSGGDGADFSWEVQGRLL